MDGSTGSGNCVVKIDLNFFSFMGVSTGSGYCFLKIDLYFFSFMDGSIGFGNCFLRIDLYFLIHRRAGSAGGAETYPLS